MGKWNDFWSKFDDTMEALPGAVDEFIEDCKGNSQGQSNRTISITSNDGSVVIRGSITKLAINGRTIRLPKEVMEGR